MTLSQLAKFIAIEAVALVVFGLLGFAVAIGILWIWLTVTGLPLGESFPGRPQGWLGGGTLQGVIAVNALVYGCPLGMALLGAILTTLLLMRTPPPR